MTDYDAMPLWPFAHDAWSGMNNVTGNFTVFQSHVPSLVHGSASEWTRVTELMSRVPWKLYPREFSHEGRPHVSDMWGNADSNQAPQPCTLHSLHLSPCIHLLHLLHLLHSLHLSPCIHLFHSLHYSTYCTCCTHCTSLPVYASTYPQPCKPEPSHIRRHVKHLATIPCDIC